MSDYGSDAPPADTFGDDRPSDNEDGLNDTAPEFNEPDSTLPVTTTMDDSDDDSLLSEVDEAQFADFDATAVQIAPDLETLNRTIKPKKPEGDDASKPKKRKEGTREKVKKNRRKVDSDDGFSGGEEIEGKRSRKSKSGADGQKEKKRRPIEDDINDADLPPE